jgi:signal peptidase II
MTDPPSTDPAAPEAPPAEPEAPRLLRPDGTSAQPPFPSIVARLPAALGGGPSYVDSRRPSYLFLAVVATLSLVADVVTKLWAETRLKGFPNSVPVWKDHIAFVLAKNKGGAWGLLQTASESVRRPFFLLVSVAAIAFIVTLYRKLTPRQTALKWGLPLVLGGALGNVNDRIRDGQVTDFIDFHIAMGGRDRHWPTFNVADIAICVGVGLMAIDMFTARRGDGGVHASGVIARARSGEPPKEEPPPVDPPSPDIAPATETKL